VDRQRGRDGACHILRVRDTAVPAVLTTSGPEPSNIKTILFVPFVLLHTAAVLPRNLSTIQ
jgi:hypothetical protein